jgi:predicted nucleic-acid-binding Zn-ribbon protein
MALFQKKESEFVTIAGKSLHCEICGHEKFWQRKAQLNTAVLSFFDLDWANRSATCIVCEKCGYIHWFLPTD